MPSPSLKVDRPAFQLDTRGCLGMADFAPSTPRENGVVGCIRGVVEGELELVSLLLESASRSPAVFALALWISAQWCPFAGFSFPLGGT
jgi:hypothetical protein